MRKDIKKLANNKCWIFKDFKLMSLALSHYQIISQIIVASENDFINLRMRISQFINECDKFDGVKNLTWLDEVSQQMTQ